jgi:hydroxypyruvate reductase
VLTRTMAGEARHLAQRHVEVLMQHAGPEPVCCLWGGEPTVTVTGDGKGGRNQEAALSAALALDGVPRPAAFLAGGTDGIDGPTDAAGAWATPGTVAQARSRGINPQARLDANDAYTVFDLLGQLIRTGPTHTNVMDVQVGLVAS